MTVLSFVKQHDSYKNAYSDNTDYAVRSMFSDGGTLHNSAIPESPTQKRPSGPALGTIARAPHKRNHSTADKISFNIKSKHEHGKSAQAVRSGLTLSFMVKPEGSCPASEACGRVNRLV